MNVHQLLPRLESAQELINGYETAHERLKIVESNKPLDASSNALDIGANHMSQH